MNKLKSYFNNHYQQKLHQISYDDTSEGNYLLPIATRKPKRSSHTTSGKLNLQHNKINHYQLQQKPIADFTWSNTCNSSAIAIKKLLQHLPLPIATETNYRLHMSRQLHIISNCNEQSQERSTSLFISFWLTNPNRSIPEGDRSCHCLLSSPGMTYSI